MSLPSEARIDAGNFLAWLDAMQAVLRGAQDADVPCGDCVGCCVSSYPIPLRVTDEAARAAVPEQHLIGPANPGEKWLMGFRDDGSCPFLVERACTIYAQRPRTCRDYDCRIYAAAGVMPDGERPVIERRVRAWQFRFPTEKDQQGAAAVAKAAEFIRSRRELFPAAMRAGSATAAAVMAIKSYALFLAPPASTDELRGAQIIEANRDFDATL
jgi:uncharacterized protein